MGKSRPAALFRISVRFRLQKARFCRLRSVTIGASQVDGPVSTFFRMADVKKSTKAQRSGMREREIRTRRMVDDSMAAAYHSVFKGREWTSTRCAEYSPGDEVRPSTGNRYGSCRTCFVRSSRKERELTIFWW